MSGGNCLAEKKKKCVYFQAEVVLIKQNTILCYLAYILGKLPCLRKCNYALLIHIELPCFFKKVKLLKCR